MKGVKDSIRASSYINLEVVSLSDRGLPSSSVNVSSLSNRGLRDSVAPSLVSG